MFFWRFRSKAFVSLLIQAEQHWSTLYTYLQCQSIPVWILNTALKHFWKKTKNQTKKTALRQRQAHLQWEIDNTAAFLHKLKSWGYRGACKICIFPWNGVPIQVYNLQHTSAQQKLWEGGPPLVTTCFSCFIVCSLHSLTFGFLSFSHTHTHTSAHSSSAELPNTAGVSGLDSNGSNQAWQIFLCGQFREWERSLKHLPAGCYVTAVVTGNHTSRLKPNVCGKVCESVCHLNKPHLT